MADDFSTYINKWVKDSKARLNLVWKLSVNDVVAYMQTPVEDGGHMPVRSGRLRKSLRQRGDSGGSLDATMLGPLGKSVTFYYTAPHAFRMNYGFVGIDSLGRHYNQKGFYFVDFAAQRWPTIVRKNAAAAKKAGNL